MTALARAKRDLLVAMRLEARAKADYEAARAHVTSLKVRAVFAEAEYAAAKTATTEIGAAQ